VVLGIPRGGLVIASEIARAIEADLDVVLAHKLRAPGHPELAIGSLAESGDVYLDRSITRQLGASEDYIRQERIYQQQEMARRGSLFRQVLDKVPLGGRPVIVTDDGVATGATTQAALWAVRQEQPSRLIAAFPVGPEETLRKLAADVDELICLKAPLYFAAIGQFYVEFGQVEDETVIKILKE
jgi:predicted phosphoribosyltransferase